MSSSWLKSALWTVCVLVVAVSFSVSVVQGPPLTTNIFSLLPREAIESEIAQVVNRKFQRQVVLLIKSERLASAEDAGREIYRIARGSSVVSARGPGSADARASSSSESTDFTQAVFSARFHLLSSTSSALLRDENWQGLSERMLIGLYNPLVGATSMLDEDPFFLFADYVGQVVEQGLPFTRGDDLLSVSLGEREHFAVIPLAVSKDVFSLDVQDSFAEFIRRSERAAEVNESELIANGAIFHAMEGVESARSDITTIGLGSLLGIVALIVVSFRSLRPLFLVMLAMATGLMCGFQACLFVFGSVHMVTLVFGASIIGVSIDYSFHYLSEVMLGGSENDRETSLAKILPGITLGLTTSSIGYLVLLLAGPFPALQQMAVFSVIGLLAAYLTVVCWFPLLVGSMYSGETLMRRVSGWLVNAYTEQPNSRVSPRTVVLSLFIPLGCVCLYSITLIEPDDDIHVLQRASLELQRDEALIARVSGLQLAGQFFVVEDHGGEELLRRTESLTERLEEAADLGSIAGFRAVTQYIPSRGRQEQNYHLLGRLIFGEGARLLADAGYRPDVIAELKMAYVEADGNSIVIQDWLGTAQAKDLELMWFEPEQGKPLSLVLLHGVTDVSPLVQIGDELDHVVFVDLAADISATLKDYRVQGTRYVMGGYLIILLLLILRYGLKKGIIIYAPPAMAALIAISLSAAIGFPINIFNTMALLIVLGIGIDYTLFFAESRSAPRSTMHGVLMAGTTTLLSFGLLALSNVPFLRAFGFVMLTGIAFVLLTSPVAMLVTRGEHSPSGRS